MQNEIEYIIEPSKRKILSFRELWQYRELFYFFTWRDVKVKYKQTTLGLFWVIVQPILSVLVFSFFFGKALKDVPKDLPYPIFVFSGLLSWSFFTACVNNSGTSMLNQAGIIKKIYFPRLIIPLSSIIASGIDLVVSFILFLVVLTVYHSPVNWVLVFTCWPASLMVLLVGTIGISCWLSALTVKYRDIKYVIPFALQILLFLTPIIYPPSFVKYQWIENILALNPMYAVIGLFRMPLTMVHAQSVYLMTTSVISSALFFIVGVYYFKKTEDFLADIA